MGAGWVKEEFGSDEEKVAYARKILSSIIGGGWSEDSKKASLEIQLTESDCNALISVYALVKEASILSDRIQHDRQFKERREAARSGFVYVIHLNEDFYKIGKSGNPEKRIQSFYNDCVKLFNSPPTLTHKIKTQDMAWAEKYFHDKYNTLRDKDFTYRFFSTEFTTEVFKLGDLEISELRKIAEFNPEWFEGEDAKSW